MSMQLIFSLAYYRHVEKEETMRKLYPNNVRLTQLKLIHSIESTLFPYEIINQNGQKFIETFRKVYFL